MWINEQTGKGWTDEEEAVFAQIMAAGSLERLPAIRLWRRCGDNLDKALRIAREVYGTKEAGRAGHMAGLAKAWEARRLKTLARAA